MALCARPARTCRPALAPRTSARSARSARVCAGVARLNGDAGTYGGECCRKATERGSDKAQSSNNK